MTLFQLWLHTTAIPGLRTAVNILLLATIIAAGLTLFACLVSEFNDDVLAFTKRHTKKALASFVLFLVMVMTLPTERQMLMIAGGYTVTNNAELTNLPTSAAKAANAWLDAIAKASDEQSSKQKMAKPN